MSESLPTATSDMQQTVLQIGHVCIDRNTVDGVSIPETWGSGLMHTRAFLQKLGITSVMIAPRGDDYAVYAAEEEFLHPPTPGAQTLVYENILVGGARTQRAHNLETSAPPRLDSIDFSKTADSRAVFVSPLTQQYDYAYLVACMERLPSRIYKVLLPQGYTRDIDAEGVVRQVGFRDAARIIPLFDLVVLSDEDTANALASARDWSRHAPGADIVVTHNQHGATVFHGPEETFVPTTAVPAAEIVEPIGLGDTFTASMATGRLSGMGSVEAVRHAHAAVAAKMRGL